MAIFAGIRLLEIGLEWDLEFGFGAGPRPLPPSPTPVEVDEAPQNTSGDRWPYPVLPEPITGAESEPVPPTQQALTVHALSPTIWRAQAVLRRTLRRLYPLVALPTPPWRLQAPWWQFIPGVGEDGKWRIGGRLRVRLTMNVDEEQLARRSARAWQIWAKVWTQARAFFWLAGAHIMNTALGVGL